MIITVPTMGSKQRLVALLRRATERAAQRWDREVGAQVYAQYRAPIDSGEQAQIDACLVEWMRKHPDYAEVRRHWEHAIEQPIRRGDVLGWCRGVYGLWRKTRG